MFIKVQYKKKNGDENKLNLLVPQSTTCKTKLERQTWYIVTASELISGFFCIWSDVPTPVLLCTIKSLTLGIKSSPYACSPPSHYGIYIDRCIIPQVSRGLWGGVGADKGGVFELS